ncbi:sorting nexin-11 isoform X3 [Panthera pardus]|nr:sorting nexin-11 isoform X4 [Felis catus]XP_006940317.1 sorting nexin-11 isoform X4 [Felis catus]XP_019271444.1 sorting nexin-11 isoform X3 [Panthera pardus]XP_019271445.1 sorting nexin-11 isoform X3 [Panthera pardus]XP_025773387.1 sorting nexin-11 [Puma concolor]XP_030152838.1 sorting nexin-11 isoform X2 [Lynx canadensis]XP_040353222.1 sorting nexin-11 isoform X3 [Puma yagouaroundi]XP_040353223.1 sorting nexin-11 isoform X3 [Puma yagouaroundi]XP_042771985.1 sorting nexin-11 isoform X2 [
MGFCCRMLENQEQEEVITVRVQDPRVQNEGSWNSYVDYKIFLHTNSKAFTAKTSCVRRRYREFVWLRKQLQRNAGLVPVPELPGKSTFFGSSDEFIEKRRQGLQHFLEKVLQSVVLLSDSQLHLFLQSQLSVPEIEACVQGRSPMTVSDAILHYAMSNCGWVQEERRGSSHLAKGDQPKSCCFLPRSGRRSSPSPPPREEKDHFEVWAPVVDSEAPSLESPPLPPSPSPSCCDFTRPDEGTSAPQPVRRAMAGDHAVPLDPGQLETVVEK